MIRQNWPTIAAAFTLAAVQALGAAGLIHPSIVQAVTVLLGAGGVLGAHRMTPPTA